jgi:hypothetical protein
MPTDFSFRNRAVRLGESGRVCAYELSDAPAPSAEHQADGRRRDGQRDHHHDDREQLHKAVCYLSHRPSSPSFSKLRLARELCNAHADPTRARPLHARDTRNHRLFNELIFPGRRRT